MKLKIFKDTYLVEDGASIDAAAQEVVERHLDNAAEIRRVATPQENEIAAQAQGGLSALATEFDKARLEATKPLRDMVALINDCGGSVVDRLRQEAKRLGKLCADYIALEQAKAKAAEATAQAELDKRERERQAAIATAKSHEEVEEIQAHFCAESASMPQVAAPALALGQSVKRDWELQFSPNLTKLAMIYPHCVKIEPRISEIKLLLSAGVTPEALALCGVTATEIVRTHTRLKA